MLPIFFGYFQLFVIILFCIINVYYGDDDDVCFANDSGQISLSFMIFILSFIISFVHLCGILISFQRCNQYSEIIRLFQWKLYKKDNQNLSFLNNDYNNVLFSFIPFQKWLNISAESVELKNYKFLFPKKNVPLILLILSKYWILTYIQFIIILCYSIDLMYDIEEETQTIFIAIGLIQCGLILCYCHLRVTLLKSTYDAIWYLLSLLSAIILVILIEIILILLLEKFFTIDINKELSRIQPPPPPMDSQHCFNGSDNLIFKISNDTINFLMKYIPEINIDIYEIEMKLIESCYKYLNLNDFCTDIFIPILYSVFIIGWSYFIEYKIFFYHQPILF